MLKSNALTTVARLSSYMDITVPTVGSASEALMQAAINAVTSFIERYTGITFKKTTFTRELYDTEKSQTLNLKHYPVISTESFILERRNSGLNEDDWETIDSEHYTVDYKAGIITMMAGVYLSRARQGYRVTYTAGYDFDNTATFLADTEAGDIEIAAWIISQDIVNSKGSDSSVKSERIGDYSVTFAEASKIMFDHPQALAILNGYKDLGDDADSLGVLTPLQTI